MNITFLGTSSGAPCRQRNVSATAIAPERGRRWVLVDCGEATQHQLLRTALSPQQLAAVLITHIHGDHCYGLPGLLASCQLNGRTEPLTLVGPPAVWEYLQAVIRFTELQISYPLEFIAVTAQLSLDQAGFAITAHPLSHRVPSWGYRLQETGIQKRLDVARLRAEGVPAGPLYARLQRGEDCQLADGRLLRSHCYTAPSRSPRTLVIGGDNDRPELLASACEGADLLIHEATYTEDVLAQVGPEPQHSCAGQVARFAQSQGLKNLILTHFSPRYRTRPRTSRERGLCELEVEARFYFDGQLHLAQDFDHYQLTHQGELVRQ